MNGFRKEDPLYHQRGVAWRRPVPATPRHPRSPLPLLPSGPDGVHGCSSRGNRHGPPL